MTDIKEVKNIEEVDLLKENNLKMRNLKTKDLPKLMRIIKKADAKAFAQSAIDMINGDVDQSVVEELQTIREKGNKEKEDKTEEEIKVIDKKMNNDLKEVLSEAESKEFMKVFTLALDTVVENFDKIYNELNDFLSGLYDLKITDVEELDLDVLFACIYNLKNQDQLVNFFKTVLKKTQ